MADAQTELYGSRLGIAATGQLTAYGTDITQEAADCTITVGAEATNVRAITVQVNDIEGNAVTSAATLKLHVFLDAAGLDYAATGGSTGIEQGTDGEVLPVVAKKYFIARTEADGDLDLTWTDTGTEAAYLGVELPGGRIVISDALTNS